MKRSERMQRVTELGERKAEDAGRQLAAAREAEGSSRALLEQLLDYRREYQQLFEARSADGMDPQRYRNFQGFFHQLDRAIAEQRRALASSEQQVEQQRSVWMEKRQHTEILARLSSRLHEEEQRDENRQEQKQADERHAQGQPKR